MRWSLGFLLIFLALGAGAGCKEEPAPVVDDGSLRFGKVGSLSAAEGKGSFRFGAATAAAQIEDGLVANDWYAWTRPKEDGGLGKGTFVGDAVKGASRAVEDVALMEEMRLDAYRFSVDWSRIEPRRDEVSQEGLAHYGAQLDQMKAVGVRPMITVHHFSSPLWVHDFTKPPCDRDATEVSDDNLCGWAHPVGAEAIIEELAEHAALLARTYGDRVDDWCTLNEPINYLIASYGVQFFPPGANLLIPHPDQLIDVFRNYLRAHVAVYEAIKANDTIDADGDGVAALVGFSLSVADWVPASGNKPSEDEVDVKAAERIWYVYHYLYPDALLTGGFDTDLDGQADEQHPEWKGKVDWLGVQYYFRAGVTGQPIIIPLVQASICFGGFDLGSCLPAEDPTHWVPDMGYEFWAPGLLKVLRAFSDRYPALPLVVTEAGIATREGARRAENIVRTLEQIHTAREEGADVRGYYHWSLMDNFEWAEGYEPKFGLYTVDLNTYARTPTEGATVLGEIAGARKITPAQVERYGGNGSMTPEPEHGDAR